MYPFRLSFCGKLLYPKAPFKAKILFPEVNQSHFGVKLKTYSYRLFS